MTLWRRSMQRWGLPSHPAFWRSLHGGGWLFEGSVQFGAVVPIAAKIAPVRFGARALIHSGRAAATCSLRPACDARPVPDDLISFQKRGSLAD
jgi:hypothetical protein